MTRALLAVALLAVSSSFFEIQLCVALIGPWESVEALTGVVGTCAA